MTSAAGHSPAPASDPQRPAVNLALQGGGSHGAFTWGVLDVLLEDGRVAIEGISGTSAGAMNAVALAQGFAQVHGKAKADPREAARAALASFWEGIVQMGALSEAQRAPFEILFGQIGGAASASETWSNAMTSFWTSTMSPYQSNPFDINPLRRFLESQIDFEALARLPAPKVFVVATRVSTGKAEVFSGKRLSADAVMASACLPMLFLFYRWNLRVSGEFFGRLVFDMIFSEGAFAEKSKRLKHLPEILLLQHWRDGGDVNKAWRTASNHLLKEARALPVWLFALETAVLYRRKPHDALKLLRRLCDAEVFPHDHRLAAVQQTRSWMESAGFPFDERPFQIQKPVLDPSGLTGTVEAKIREGRFGQAEALLRQVLAEDSLNEGAFTQLVRLYAQDLKKRGAAASLIAEARDTFSPKVLDYLSASLDEWMRLPLRSTAKPRTILGWLLRRKHTDPTARKFSLPNQHEAVAAKSTDPVELYLERVKKNQPPAPDTSGVQDRVQKLLLERRLGTAIDLLKEQAEAAPENFDLWLRYAEAHGNHCGNPMSAEKIIQRMDRSGHFKKVQMKKAHNHLGKWRKKHPSRQSGW